MLRGEGFDRMWCFPVVVIPDQALDWMACNTGWAVYSVLFHCSTITQYVGVFYPEGPLAPNLLQSGYPGLRHGT